MEGSLVNYTLTALNPIEYLLEEEEINITIPQHIEDTTIVISNGSKLKLKEAHLFLVSYCTFVIVINFLFMYVILRSNLNRSPFYLALLHISIFSTVYIVCGVLATLFFGIPNYTYHIFTNSKHITITFQTILFTIFIFEWFMKSECHARNIVIVFWIQTISFIFLGCVAVSCGDRLFYSFYIIMFLSFTVLLATFVLVIIAKFTEILHDEKKRNRLLLVLVYILCFLPNYLLLIFDVHLYNYEVVDFICPILIYGHSFVNVIFIALLDSYLRLHLRKICKRTKTYQQNSHFPVDAV
ncbi:hypothetical protein AMK59_2654 [Oryctes borbonicus]|uniref:Uncharacterized protein n=1 Tax=Oryctes borbonicus TaxID=1629725 RepID=A0A0T6BDM9_9SCAR|nr:hypothetical protein AMK59_2654 [Oryctes borbonicus]